MTKEGKKKATVSPRDIEDDPYNKELRFVIDFFGPAISRLQNHSDVPSSFLMFHLGRRIGRAIGRKMESNTLSELIDELSKLWENLDVAKIMVEGKDPPSFIVSNCMVCGQVPGITPFRCHFHEGVFQGILDERVGKGVWIQQVECIPGEAGTLSRRFHVIGKESQAY